MPTRSRTSAQKRQKEIARQEKQRDKVARRAQRNAGDRPLGASDLVTEYDPVTGEIIVRESEEDALAAQPEAAESPASLDHK